ncbi:MAG: DUF1822 family protein [Cyanobacterium sp. T60_A2020_053]|nr:DUF1822 family protein [Cyanobacterium sp. T60_A2020_053]
MITTFATDNKIMKLDFFTSFNDEHLWLEFSDEDWEEAKMLVENNHEQSIINLLISKCFLQWLNTTYEEAEEATLDQSVEKYLPIWSLFTGVAIQINNLRLILIPQDYQNLEWFNIPQEWVDIPQFAGNYYLPVEVNLDDQWLKIAGFISHQDIKNYGSFNTYLRGYFLNKNKIEAELNLLFILEEYNGSQSLSCPTLFPLLPEKEQKIITQLKLLPNYLLRYQLPFEEWGAFIAQSKNRQLLFKTHQPLKLGDWLNNNFEQATMKGWYNLVNFADNFSIIFNPPSLAMNGLSMRQGDVNIEQFYQLKEERQMKIVAERLRSISVQSSKKNQVLALLNHFMDQCHDEDTRWTIAESIWQLEPYHRGAGLWFGKKFDLGINLSGNKFTLVIGILGKSASENSIFIKLYGEPNQILPTNLKLVILNQEGEIFQELSARHQDLILQYKFWGQKGEYFWLTITQGDNQLTESFII